MNTRLAKIGLVVTIIGFVIMFGNFILPCESNTMIQTLWTHFCMLSTVILAITSNVLSYVLVLVGIVIFLSNWIVEKTEKVWQ